MALIKCPECGKDVSDKAVSCPNCGCPVSEMIILNEGHENVETAKQEEVTIQEPIASEAIEREQLELSVQKNELEEAKAAEQKEELVCVTISDRTVEHKQSRKKKWLIVIVPITFIAIICVWQFYMRPIARYNSAVEMYDNGQYSEAIDILKDIRTSESSALIEKCTKAKHEQDKAARLASTTYREYTLQSHYFDTYETAVAAVADLANASNTVNSRFSETLHLFSESLSDGTIDPSAYIAAIKGYENSGLREEYNRIENLPYPSEWEEYRRAIILFNHSCQEVLDRFCVCETSDDTKVVFENGLDDDIEEYGDLISEALESQETFYSNMKANYRMQNATKGEKNALASAHSYLNAMAFSYTGLINQLKYEGYSSTEATFAADYCGANWNEQAAKCAKSYLNSMSFSRSGLIDQLEYDGFTHSQAVYGVNQNGY